MRVRNPAVPSGAIGPVQTNYPYDIWRLSGDKTLAQAPSDTLILSVDLSASAYKFDGGGFGIFLFQAFFQVTAGLTDAVIDWYIRFPGAGLNYIVVAQGSFTVPAGTTANVTEGGMFVNLGAADATFEWRASSSTTDATINGELTDFKETRIVALQIGLNAAANA